MRSTPAASRSTPGPRARAEPSPERRSRRSHEAVLEAAEALLAESGYASITIDQVAERAGVSKATIYRWWPTKAAIFMELYAVLGSRVRQPPPDTGSLGGDLREQVRSAFRLFRETVAGLALAGFVAEGQSNPQTARMLRDTFATQRRQLNVALLARAVRRGELAPGLSLEIASEVITGAVYYAVLIGQATFSDQRADEIVRVILHGLETRAPPAPALPSTKTRRS